MAKIEAYKCDLCGKLTEKPYNETYFCKIINGKMYEGFIKLCFEKDTPSVCNKCAEIFVKEGGVF